MTWFEQKLIDRLRAAGIDGMKFSDIARENQNWPHTRGVLDSLVTQGVLVKRFVAGSEEYACPTPPQRRS